MWKWIRYYVIVGRWRFAVLRHRWFGVHCWVWDAPHHNYDTCSICHARRPNFRSAMLAELLEIERQEFVEDCKADARKGNENA